MGRFPVSAERTIKAHAGKEAARDGVAVARRRAAVARYTTRLHLATERPGSYRDVRAQLDLGAAGEGREGVVGVEYEHHRVELATCLEADLSSVRERVCEGVRGCWDGKVDLRAE